MKALNLVKFNQCNKSWPGAKIKVIGLITELFDHNDQLFETNSCKWLTADVVLLIKWHNFT